MEDIYEKIVEEGIKKMSIMAAPTNSEISLEIVLDRLKNSEDIVIESYEFADNILDVDLNIEGESVKYALYVAETFTNPLFQLVHYIPDSAKNELEENKNSLYIETFFGEDNLKSYLNQMNLLIKACPELILLVDISAEKYISKEWAFMATRDQLLPSPTYLYSIQSIVDDNDNVWMHTHGLNRCGVVEVEVMGAKRDNAQLFFPVVDSVACRFLDGNVTKPKEFIYLGHGIAVTWVPWEDEVENYGSMIGGKDDRSNHSDPAGMIYAYKTPDDYEMGNYVHLSEIASLLEENPVFFYSNKETERMSSLAIGRINHFRDKFFEKRDDFYFYVKLGYEVDEDMVEEIGEKEHLWFAVSDIDVEKNEVEGVLLNEPYGIKSLKEGETLKKHFKYITDWLIKSPHGDITPDSVYVLYYI
jgi:uncharacterized protein YegJ (DUF2314 family)